MKKMITRTVAVVAIMFAAVAAHAATVVDMSRYGIRPDRTENLSPKMARALADIKARYGDEGVTLRFQPGRYNFHEKGALTREYYISNHDQDNPKHVAIAIEDWDNVTIDGAGAEFIFHGSCMLPVAVIGSSNTEMRDFSIDFANPHIAQVEVIESGDEGITFATAPWVKASVDKSGAFLTHGEGWTERQRTGIAFERDTRHIVYRTSDLWIPADSVIALGDNRYRAPKWVNKALTPGTMVAMRSWARPTPGIFLAENTDTRLDNVKVHYARGMGLLAQLCDGITMTGFGVCLRGDDDPRYFTTQADATHFSGCKGHIKSVDGLYENMMDDAINVHGTYLKVTGRTGTRTLRGRYMHDQSYGFKWGEPGDTVQPVAAPTMELLGTTLVIESITPADRATTAGAREFDITFTTDLPDTLDANGEFGLENLAWTPSVEFAGNIVRNNRARGALFSTPRKVVCERNLFDHTSGTAILLCGDCMGWYETGACRDVTIRGNRFVNALTNLFQFTEAVISIFPEIKDLAGQRLYFHGGPGTPGIVIEDNDFDTFDNPLLFAKSTYGLTFRNNRITRNNDYPAFHHNTFSIKLLRVADARIYGNSDSTPTILVE
ncbi:MAG: alpha-1,3-galactosidase B [Paramuribaculum sp.]|nr:alpha-1,3-galactosidase B [Paramuribaculum sp.]